MAVFTVSNATVALATNAETQEQTLTISVPRFNEIRRLNVNALYYVNITRDSLSRYILTSYSIGNIGVRYTTDLQ